MGRLCIYIAQLVCVCNYVCREFLLVSFTNPLAAGSEAGNLSSYYKSKTVFKLKVVPHFLLSADSPA